LPALGEGIIVGPKRIAFDWNGIAVPIKCVNPLDLDGVDQIHAVGGSFQAIPTDRHLV
jgi:hypothetical protein